MLVGCGFNLSESSRWAETLIVLQVGEHGRVASKGARGEQRIVRGENQVAAAADLNERGRGSWLQMLVVAAEKLQAKKIVAGNQSLDLIENRERIEWAELGFEIVGSQPDGMAI